MKLNRSRALLVVMAFITLALGVTAVFVGWRVSQPETVDPVPSSADGPACSACDGTPIVGDDSPWNCCANTTGCNWNGNSCVVAPTPGPEPGPTSDPDPGSVCTGRSCDPSQPRSEQSCDADNMRYCRVCNSTGTGYETSNQKSDESCVTTNPGVGTTPNCALPTNPYNCAAITDPAACSSQHEGNGCVWIRTGNVATEYCGCDGGSGGRDGVVRTSCSGNTCTATYVSGTDDADVIFYGCTNSYTTLDEYNSETSNGSECTVGTCGIIGQSTLSPSSNRTASASVSIPECGKWQIDVHVLNASKTEDSVSANSACNSTSCDTPPPPVGNTASELIGRVACVDSAGKIISSLAGTASDKAKVEVSGADGSVYTVKYGEVGVSFPLSTYSSALSATTSQTYAVRVTLPSNIKLDDGRTIASSKLKPVGGYGVAVNACLSNKYNIAGWSPTSNTDPTFCENINSNGLYVDSNGNILQSGGVNYCASGTAGSYEHCKLSADGSTNAHFDFVYTGCEEIPPAIPVCTGLSYSKNDVSDSVYPVDVTYRGTFSDADSLLSTYSLKLPDGTTKTGSITAGLGNVLIGTSSVSSDAYAILTLIDKNGKSYTSESCQVKVNADEPSTEWSITKEDNITQSCVASDGTVNYTIKLKNEGNVTALVRSVVDVLDPKVDMTKVTAISSSDTNVDYKIDGRQIIWKEKGKELTASNYTGISFTAGETKTFTYSVKMATAGQYDNTVTANPNICQGTKCPPTATNTVKVCGEGVLPSTGALNINTLLMILGSASLGYMSILMYKTRFGNELLVNSLASSASVNYSLADKFRSNVSLIKSNILTSIQTRRKGRLGKKEVFEKATLDKVENE